MGVDTKNEDFGITGPKATSASLETTSSLDESSSVSNSDKLLSPEDSSRNVNDMHEGKIYTSALKIGSIGGYVRADLHKGTYLYDTKDTMTLFHADELAGKFEKATYSNTVVEARLATETFKKGGDSAFQNPNYVQVKNSGYLILDEQRHPYSSEDTPFPPVQAANGQEEGAHLIYIPENQVPFTNFFLPPSSMDHLDAASHSYITPAEGQPVVNALFSVSTAKGLLNGLSEINSSADGTLTIIPIIALTTTHGGTVTVAADGSFIYIPPVDYYGIDTFFYQVTNGTESSAPALVTLGVTPVAVPDVFSTNTGEKLTVSAGNGVLINDGSLVTNPLQAILNTMTSHGGITLNLDGSFTYTPNTGYYGLDNFTYHVTDTNNVVSSAPITVTLAINPVATPDIFSTNTGGKLAVSGGAGVLANDGSLVTNPLLAILNTTTTHGSLTLNQDGSFTYTPNAGYYGLDSFTYHVVDTNGVVDSDVIGVSLEIDPVAVADTYQTNVSTVLTVSAAAGVLVNDGSLVTNPLLTTLNTTTTHGSLTLNLDGSFTYTPNAGYYGLDSFTYHVVDTNGVVDSDVIGVSLEIDPVAVADTYQTNVSTVLTVSAAAGVLVNDGSLVTNPLLTTLNTTTTHGSLTLNLDGSFTYTPNAGYYGLDSFTYHVVDTNGVVDSDVIGVSLEIDPVAVADTYQTNVSTVLTVLTGAGVLANDGSLVTNPLLTTLNTTTTHGSLTLNLDGSFTYTPNAGYYGLDSFTYHVVDTNGVVDSDVIGVSLEIDPIAVADTYQTNAGAVLTVSAGSGVLANDGSLVTNPLLAILNTATTYGSLILNQDGSFTYTPNAGYYGTDSFSYEVVDANNIVSSATAVTVMLTINPPLIPIDDAYTITRNSNSANNLNVDAAHGVLANDENIPSSNLAYLIDDVSGGKLAFFSDGSFSYVAQNFVGTTTFTYHVQLSDGSFSNAATVTITVEENPGDKNTSSSLSSLSSSSPIEDSSTFLNSDSSLTTIDQNQPILTTTQIQDPLIQNTQLLGLDSQLKSISSTDILTLQGLPPGTKLFAPNSDPGSEPNDTGTAGNYEIGAVDQNSSITLLGSQIKGATFGSLEALGIAPLSVTIDHNNHSQTFSFSLNLQNGHLDVSQDFRFESFQGSTHQPSHFVTTSNSLFVNHDLTTVSQNLSDSHGSIGQPVSHGPNHTILNHSEPPAHLPQHPEQQHVEYHGYT